MASEYQIRANYNAAIRAAESLESIAKSIENLANSELEGALNALGTSWKGENAERFVGKGKSVKSQIADTASDVRRAASELRSDAKSTYDTEMRALEIARRRAEEAARAAAAMKEAMEKATNTIVVTKAPEQVAGTISSAVSSVNGGNGGGGSR